MTSPAPAPPAKIRVTHEPLEIVIPLRRLRRATRVVAVLSVVWAFGEVFAMRKLLSGPFESSSVFAFVWTLMILWVMSSWSWLLRAGKEIIRLRPNRLSIKTANGTVVYDPAAVTNLRVVSTEVNTWLSRSWGAPRLAFDYAGMPRGVYFAYGVDDADAVQIESVLRSSLPVTIV
jgi:hypothetical protein